MKWYTSINNIKINRILYRLNMEKKMNLIVNGEDKEYQTQITLLELMQDLNIVDKVMAAAVNMNIVKQDVWNQHELNDGDKVELLDFVGGG